MILSIAPQRETWKARLSNAFAAIYRGLHGGIYKGGEIAARWYLFSSYQNIISAKSLKEMVAEEGLEPPTRGL